MDARDLGSIQVSVAYFGSKSCSEDVTRSLRLAGCRVHPWSGKSSSSAGLAGVRSIAVLAIGRLVGPSRTRVLRTLEQLGQRPILGLFTQDPHLWDPELLRRCSEFSGWPCSEQELHARLNRLWGCHASAADHVSDAALASTSLELNLVGGSPAFMASLDRARRFARCDVPVLIQGETGTGKELLARAVHYLGVRKEYPFVPVNCGALPENLVENELFGHERGAFTDARGPHPGLIAQAEGGTLFLDEVEALSPRAQVALLRFLQEQEYRPLGARESRRADVRVIAATNECLSTLARHRSFREDLMYRLDVMRVMVPPLRERCDDVIKLAEHFLQIYRTRYGQPAKHLHADSVQWLRAYDWPGNVRELENLIHREFLLCDGDMLVLGDADNADSPATGSTATGSPGASFRSAKAEAVAAFERRYLEELMRKAHGNVSLAARIAGKERRALGRLLKKHHIDRLSFSEHRAWGE